MSTVYEKMKKICDNIRSRTGKTGLLTLDGIAQAILTIGGDGVTIIPTTVALIKGMRYSQSGGAFQQSANGAASLVVPVKSTGSAIKIELTNMTPDDNYPNVYYGADKITFDTQDKDASAALKTSVFYLTEIPAGNWYVVFHVDQSGVDHDYSNAGIKIDGEEARIVVTLDSTIAEFGKTESGDKPAYTNIIDTIGYTDGYRLSSSTGDLTTLSGYTTTGFIDFVEYGLPITLRTKGVNFNITYANVALYNLSTGAFVSAVALNNTTIMSEGWNGLKTSFDDEGNLTLTTSSTNIQDNYKIKISGQGKGADLIVTINEEITESIGVTCEITDNNIVMLTGDLPDGKWTFKYKTIDDTLLTIGDIIIGIVSNNVIDTVGIEDGVRLRGVGTTQSGYDSFVSGYFEAAKGDLIRVYMPNGSFSKIPIESNVIVICDSSKTVLTALTTTTHDEFLKLTDTGYSYRVVNEDAVYARVAGGPAGGYTDFVVTVNEKIPQAPELD